MAGKTINYDLKVTDSSNSMQKRTQEAQKYHDVVSSTDKLMNKRRASAYRAESQDYGATRALGVGTGASGRDFAKEAQGLGGLVRLYATLAANIFAVTAAANQLSQAMATSNMIKGMQQLGAQAGISYGNIAKNLVEVTDYAISTREALEATAMATSAGLSADQLKNIGIVAKNVSQALGRDVTDSIGRLTRGVVKLEPELLDELGLFTKIGPATEKYALSIGKSASQLTDFERRQAFANAVIKEGLDKFSNIQLDANPYNKLLATFKDVALAGLELINKVLGPAIKLLSESPMALGAALAYFATMLIKQAIPALNDFGAAMRHQTEQMVSEQLSRASKIQAVIKAASQARLMAADAEAEATSLTWERNTNVLMSLEKEKAKKLQQYAGRSGMMPILEKGVNEVTDEDLAKLDKMAQKQGALGRIYAQAAANVRQYRIEDEAYQQTKAQNIERELKAMSLLTTAGREMYKAERMSQMARNARIVSDAAEVTGLLGLREGWRQLNEEISKARSGPQTFKFIDPKTKEEIETTIQQMSKFDAAKTKLFGGIRLATQYMSNLLGFFGIWGQAVAIAVAGVSAFYEATAKAQESLKRFDDALEKNDANVKTLADTYKAILDKPIDQVFNSASVIAQANAVQALSQSLGDMRKKAREAFADLAENGSLLEKMFQGLKTLLPSVFGKNIDDRAMTSISNSIVEQVKALRQSSEGAAYLEEFGKVLNVKDPAQNLESVVNAVKDLGVNSPKLDRLAEAWKTYSDNLQKAKQQQESFNNSLTKAQESWQRFATQYAINDPLTRFIIDASKAMTEFNDLLNSSNVENQLAGISKMMEKVNSIPFFTGTQFGEINNIATRVSALNRELGDSTQRLGMLQKERDKLEKATSGFANITGTPEDMMANQFDLSKDVQRLEEVRMEMSALNKSIAEAQVRLKTEGKNIIENMGPAMVKYGQYFANVVSATLAKGANDFRMHALGRITDLLPEASMDVANLKNKEISSQMSLIKTNLELIKTIKTSDAERRALEYDRQIEENKRSAFLFGLNAADTRLPEAIRSASQLAVQQLEARNVELEAQAKAARGEKSLIESIFRNPSINVAKAAAGTGAGAGAVTGAAEFAASVAGGRAQLNQMSQQQQINTSDAVLAKLDKELKLTERRNAAFRLGLDLTAEEASLTASLTDRFIDQAMAAEKIAGFAKIERDYNSEIEQIDNRRKREQAAIAEAFKGATDPAATAKKLQAEQTSKELADADRLNAAAKKRNSELGITTRQTLQLRDINNEIGNSIIETNDKLQDIDFSLRADRLDVESQISTILNERGLLLDDEFQALKKNEAITRITFELEQARAKINRDANNKLANIELNRSKYTQEGYEAAIENAITLRDAELEAAQIGSNNKLQMLDIQNDLTKSQEKYADLLKSTVNGLTDAIVNFAKTGKLAFKDFVVEALAGLLKLQLQMAIIDPLRKSLMSSFFPMAMGQASSSGGYVGFAERFGAVPGAAAKGALFTATNSYFGSIEKYAKGGLLNQPSLFSHSGGSKLAVAGEAGPEFVMPATRTSNGNLGVRAVGGKTEINIHNYGGGEVQATESTDSRGNRSIDIVVGEIVSTNMAKSGSPMQQSMRGTYGLKPSVIRR